MDFNDGHGMSVELKTLPAGKPAKAGRWLMKWAPVLSLAMKPIEWVIRYLLGIG